MGRLTRGWVWTGLWIFLVGVALLALCVATYLNHLRSTATALINSAQEIRTKADAEREITAWRTRSGKDFWGESDHPGDDHNYDAQIVNLPIARLHIVEPTGVTVGVTMRDGELRSVTVIESTGWYPVASVWIQEWFDEKMPHHFHMSGKGRPYATTVEFPSSLPEEQRKRAFAVGTKVLGPTRRMQDGGGNSAWNLATRMTSTAWLTPRSSILGLKFPISDLAQKIVTKCWG